MERPLSGSPYDLIADLLSRIAKDDEFALDVIDWMLQHGSNLRDYYEIAGWAGALGEMLLSGGSVWEVSAIDDFEYRLTRRTVGPVVEVLENTATVATRAHDHLFIAWSKLVGRNPDPTGAYREAIRAVEAVAKPVILPDNDLATLGQMVASLRDKPEKWATTIGTVDDVRAQMEVVHKGQLDRHGTDDVAVPLNVSQMAADAAFSVCLNLVRQFAGGHVVRVTP